MTNDETKDRPAPKRVIIEGVELELEAMDLEFGECSDDDDSVGGRFGTVEDLLQRREERGAE